MHGDAIATLPLEAVWLAYSERYPHQAYRVGPCAWGVQFHPEISPLTYRIWAEEFQGSDMDDRQRVERGMVEFPEQDVLVVTAARHIAARFAQLVHVSSSPPC